MQLGTGAAQALQGSKKSVISVLPGIPRPLFNQRFGLELFGSSADFLAQASRMNTTGSS
ncbi:MAG: hypothetical protein ACI9CV_002098 [Ilumatobacter sp.]|jgi:hypothetical protein